MSVTAPSPAAATEVAITYDPETGEAQTSATSGTDWKRLQSLLTQLRKCCNHPYLFPGANLSPEAPHEGIVTSSGKMVVLDRLLKRLKGRSHRCCVFSQFTQTLDLLEDYCNLRGFKYCRLDGSTNRVQRMIDVEMYNKEGSDIFMFLMSTRAGGVGINLATADTVILYDSDWNPQVGVHSVYFSYYK